MDDWLEARRAAPVGARDYEHQGQVRWAIFAAANDALAIAPDWEEPITSTGWP